MKNHPARCFCCGPTDQNNEGTSRRDFLLKLGAAGIGLGLAPLAAFALDGGKSSSLLKSNAIRSGKAKHITLLHTTDIHGQLHVHDEFFWENNQATFRKRGGLAHLKTLIQSIRKENPNTLLVDGGDCFQGSGIAALTEGRALTGLMNNLHYDIMLPGNWEVVYGKKILVNDMNLYSAKKICANMFNAEAKEEELMFAPYHCVRIGDIKIGFLGYNDPLTPIRQAPAYSKGINFTQPEKNIAQYIRILRDKEKCNMVIALTHMGMAQQIHLANQPYAEGLDYIFGADTHERIRTPLEGKYAKVTEPGAFSSFIGRMDFVMEDGKIKEESYELIEVDPDKYAADPEMERLIAKAEEPYQKQLKKVIGRTTTPLFRYYVIETPMDNLITDALMWKASPDIAISNGFRFCPALVPDPTTGFAEITKEFLWSMLPVDSDVKMAEVSGTQIKEWLEKELENVFAKDATKRFGGWLVKFQGMKIVFTIGNPVGKRIQEILINEKPMQPNEVYKVLACEREGDPDDLLCRIKDVKNARKMGYTLHQVMEEYLAAHPSVAPKLEGRAVATDGSPYLLSQVSGMNYQFR